MIWPESLFVVRALLFAGAVNNMPFGGVGEEDVDVDVVDDESADHGRNGTADSCVFLGPKLRFCAAINLDRGMCSI